MVLAVTRRSSPNRRLQRTRQLTRFRRQLQLALESRRMVRNDDLRSVQTCGQTGLSLLDEGAFRALQDATFAASAAGAVVQSQFCACLSASNRSAPEHRLVRCPLNRVKIPRLRSPLSRKPFGVETGVHAVFHERACELAPRSVYMRAGRAFALCPGCRDGVLYQLPGPSR